MCTLENYFMILYSDLCLEFLYTALHCLRLLYPVVSLSESVMNAAAVEPTITYPVP
jgi:hypothetical protein